jgi:hypothetical protein
MVPSGFLLYQAYRGVVDGQAGWAAADDYARERYAPSIHDEDTAQ